MRRPRGAASYSVYFRKDNEKYFNYKDWSASYYSSHPEKKYFDYLRSYFRVDWYQTTLRYWLNYNFINGAFSDQDQQVILYANFLKTTEDMFSNQRTLFSDDQIFLLSTIDIDKYFDSTETTLTIATDAAQQQAASLNSDSG